jgi:hypothetical protein
MFNLAKDRNPLIAKISRNSLLFGIFKSVNMVLPNNSTVPTYPEACGNVAESPIKNKKDVTRSRSGSRLVQAGVDRWRPLK